jgi:ubiquinone/menaquinone biosynthesis C-methylase UbiE
LGKRAL